MSDILMAAVGIGAMGIGGYFIYKGFQTDTSNTGGAATPPAFKLDDQATTAKWQQDQYNQALTDPAVTAPGSTIAVRGDTATAVASACPAGWSYFPLYGCMAVPPNWDTTAYQWQLDAAGACNTDQYAKLDPSGNVSCQPKAIAGRQTGWDQAWTLGGGGVGTYSNEVNYLKTLAQQPAIDRFGCWDSVAQVDDTTGKVLQTKICADAAACYNEATAGTGSDKFSPTDFGTWSTWGQALAKGDATCGVMGGKQKGTVSFLNLGAINQIRNIWNNPVAGTTEADVLAYDYSGFGDTVSWDDYAKGKTQVKAVVDPSATPPPAPSMATYVQQTAAEGKPLIQPSADGKSIVVAGVGVVPTRGNYPNAWSCSKDSDCGSGNCNRASATDGTPLTCNANKDYRYGGFDYASNMKKGTVCWADDMCASRTCDGNWGGTKRGKCT